MKWHRPLINRGEVLLALKYSNERTNSQSTGRPYFAWASKMAHDAISPYHTVSFKCGSNLDQSFLNEEVVDWVPQTYCNAIALVANHRLEAYATSFRSLEL